MYNLDDLTFQQIFKNDEEMINNLIPKWIAYMREVHQEDDEMQEIHDSEIEKWLRDRINIQGQSDTMHFEIIIHKHKVIGFTMYAVDLGGIKGILDAGYGYIMEIYVQPLYRRKGFGKMIFKHILQVFKNHGVIKMYLTPDTKSGIPFWETIGFENSNKIDPDNHMPIYMCEVYKTKVE